MKMDGKTEHNDNPLLVQLSSFLSTIPESNQRDFFSDSHITPETRAEIWSDQAEIGESLVNQYSWAIPDERSLKIIDYFASSHGNKGIVEIGCGANAYWAKLIHDSGVNVLAFDVELNEGGKINDESDTTEGDETHGNVKDDENNRKKRKHHSLESKDSAGNAAIGDNTTTIEETKSFENGLVIYKGGPEVLSSNCKFEDMDQRVLFLCYPDEDIFSETEGIDDGNDDDHDSDRPSSMGAACLEYFKGDTIIHVGEIYGDTLSMDHAPWGRSSGAEFQQRLFSEYHCILKAKLPNWLHVRDTISVWKRTQRCTIVFQGEHDGEDDDVEESEYKHIPEDEKLQIDIAAPCAKHLL